MASSAALAETPSQDLSNCLPPAQGVQRNLEHCTLVHKKPSHLRQDVIVNACAFLPIEFEGGDLRLFECAVLNETDEAIVSFYYAVRYYRDGKLLAESDKTSQFATENIDGTLLTGETRTMRFLGPKVPAQAKEQGINISVEVTGVHAHESKSLLR